jgi:tRNA (guanine-N(7)-)-methyltransferase subunit TRM82
MKQLLQNCGEHIIVGLNDTVYYGSGDAFCELLAPQIATTYTAVPMAADDKNESDINPLEVQAVAVTVNKSGVVWCAVARYDKNLVLYTIGDDKAKAVVHRTVHKSVKRVSTLSFATLPGKSNDGMTVIVAGDLAGDATAFPLEFSEGDDKESSEDEENNKHRRLLLGHTASMLTSVYVVETEDSATKMRQRRILTSDRDEKIRVSSFPETHCIEGFLLGHEAFVSALAVSPQTGRCVSLGGDDTLRLWDFTTCQELAVTSTSETTASEGDDDNTNEAEQGTTPKPVPSKVAMNTNGDMIVTICDDSTQSNLWKVRPASDTANNNSDAPDELNTREIELYRCQRFECAAQPLAVSFLSDDTLLVVMREPEYIQAFTVAKDDQAGVSITALYGNPFCGSVRHSATVKSIVMPDRLLEKDEHGNLKMQKMNEKRSGATLKPWNNAVRKETAKEATKRLRKRRREQHEVEQNDQEVQSDNSN